MGEALYGQDAQHPDTTPRYRDNGDGTINASDKRTLVKAAEGASAITVGAPATGDCRPSKSIAPSSASAAPICGPMPPTPPEAFHSSMPTTSISVTVTSARATASSTPSARPRPCTWTRARPYTGGSTPDSPACPSRWRNCAPTRAVGRCAASRTWLAPRAKGWGASSGIALRKLRTQLFLPVRPRPRTSRVAPDRNPRALPCHSVAVLIKARPLSPSISTSRGSSLWLHEQDPMLRSLGRAERLSQSTPLAPREGTAR